VYDYLYKFSFERLQFFLDDAIMVMLFFHMLEVRAASRPRGISALHSLAELEASLIILQRSCFKTKLARAYC